MWAISPSSWVFKGGLKMTYLIQQLSLNPPLEVKVNCLKGTEIAIRYNFVQFIKWKHLCGCHPRTTHLHNYLCSSSCLICLTNISPCFKRLLDTGRTHLFYSNTRKCWQVHGSNQKEFNQNINVIFWDYLFGYYLQLLLIMSKHLRFFCYIKLLKESEWVIFSTQHYLKKKKNHLG